MRLIDADVFKEQVAAMALKGIPVKKANAMCELIDHQQTAYNLDKVMGELEQLRNKTMELVYDVPLIDTIIEIVKRGGIDDGN